MCLGRIHGHIYRLTGDLEVGDYVELDEEIATIETDKARDSAEILVAPLTVVFRSM